MEEPDTPLILSGNESVQLTTDKWKGAEMRGREEPAGYLHEHL